MKTLETLLFSIDQPRRNVASGTLLVAEPFLRESYFNHAVVCLVDYGENEKAMGLTLNKATSYTLGNLVSRVVRPEPIPVFCGGPLSLNHLFFLHRLGDILPGAKPVGNGVYFGGEFDIMVDYVNSGAPIDGQVRFFLGYSGWDVGQLADELLNNVWAVVDDFDEHKLLCGIDDAYWHNYVKMLGNDYRGWLYHPHNPQLN